MKKLLALLLAALLIVTLVACTTPTQPPAAVVPTATPGDGGGAEELPLITVGIIQIFEHPALDAAREGFIDTMLEMGFNVEFDYHSAQGDAATMTTIAQRFVNNNVDLILAVGTGAAVAAAAETQTIPIVGTAITSYTRPGLAETDDRPGWNITGASDFKPVAAQVEMIAEFVPDIQVLGILYNAGEPNSVVQGALARETAIAMG